MPRTFYERLSNESAALLSAESSRSLAHSSALLVLEPGPLAAAEGGVAFEAIRAAIEARLALVPRTRQKLRWIPIEDHPIWVDDPNFNLECHVRHTSLPRPGNEKLLRRLVGFTPAVRPARARSGKPAIEGLEHGRRAAKDAPVHGGREASGPDLLETPLTRIRHAQPRARATARRSRSHSGRVCATRAPGAVAVARKPRRRRAGP
jgi:hypothetical protein